MKEQHIQLLKELAEKLGTTVEHLWGVLVRQAFITATVDLLLMILGLTFWVIILLIGLKKAGNADAVWFREDDDREQWRGIAIWVAFAIWSLIILIDVAWSVGPILTGYLNPEYWALDQVTEMLK